MVWAGLIGILLAMALSAMAVPLTARMAVRFNMLDIPGRHKAHARPVPLLGGCAIFFAILMPSMLALAMARLWAAQPPSWLPAEFAVHLGGIAAKAPQALGILAGALGLHILGLVDDRKALGPWIKLLVQTAVAVLVVIFCHVRVLTVLGAPLSIIVSTIWLVTIMNAFNFLDNMDGLSAGVAAICAAALLGAAASLGQVFVSAWLCLILGSVLGFLLHNFPPARTFMGDAGSLVIGYLLAVVSCLTTYVQPGTHYLYGVFVPLVVMAVPLYDTCSVIVLRIRSRSNPMVGDRRHFSHRLLRRGMSTRAAVLTVYLCTGATAVSASLLSRVTQVWEAVLIFVQTVAILLVIALLESGDGKP